MQNRYASSREPENMSPNTQTVASPLTRAAHAVTQVLLSELDKLVGDLKDHEQELYNKLVTIMRERVDVHCRNLAEEVLHPPSTLESVSRVQT